MKYELSFFNNEANENGLYKRVLIIVVVRNKWKWNFVFFNRCSIQLSERICCLFGRDDQTVNNWICFSLWSKMKKTSLNFSR